MPDMDTELIYETCPICEGKDESCAWCGGEGIVEHECEFEELS